MMRIALTSVIVNDQEKALKFYTEILGFVKKTDILVIKCALITLIADKVCSILKRQGIHNFRNVIGGWNEI